MRRELFQRDDDTLKTVTERLEVFKQQTAPVVDYYRELGLLTVVNGNTEISQVLTRSAQRWISALLLLSVGAKHGVRVGQELQLKKLTPAVRTAGVYYGSGWISG